MPGDPIGILVARIVTGSGGGVGGGAGGGGTGSISQLLYENWILKFGWSHTDPNFDKKYKTLDINQMIDLFNDGNISNSNCKIDRNKLDFLNKKWSRMK